MDSVTMSLGRSFRPLHWIALTLGIALSLAACGDTEEGDPAADDETVAETEDTPAEAPDDAGPPDDYPNEPITLIVPAGPGGGWDAMAQLLREPWSDRLGGEIRIEHMPDAGGYVARERVATAPGDGYTTLITGNEFSAVSLYLNGSAYSLVDDYYPIGNLNTDAVTVFVPTDSPYENLSDLLEDAAEQEISIAVTSVNSINHLAGLVLQQESGLGDNLNIVPLQDGAETRTAVAGGHVAAGISPSQGILAFMDQIRPVGFFYDQNPAPDLIDADPIGDQLDVEIPNVPFTTSIQVPMSAYEEHPDRVAWLVQTLRETLEDPEVVAQLDEAGLGVYMDYWTPEETQTYFTEVSGLVDQYAGLFDN